MIPDKEQKQLFRGVLRKRCSENMQQIYRRTPMPKCNFNKVTLQLKWNCSLGWVFPSKFAAYFPNTFPQDQLWMAASKRTCLIRIENYKRISKRILTLEQAVVSGSMALLTNNSIKMTLKTFFWSLLFLRCLMFRSFHVDKATFVLQNLNIILFKVTFSEQFGMSST